MTEYKGRGLAESHLPEPSPPSETVEAALSLLPYLDGDYWAEKKLNYLAYRYTGFSVREAVQLADIHEKTVQRWRADERFRELEQRATGPERAVLRREILHLLFVKNYHLVLRKDFDVLQKSLGLIVGTDGKPVMMSNVDIRYLERARAHYSPQQLEVIEKLLDPSDESKPFDFSEFVKTIQYTKSNKVTLTQTVTLEEAESAIQS